MDRRRFLKYAGVAGAAIGASALGLNYLPQQNPSMTSPTTSTTLVHRQTTTSTSLGSSTESVQLASLQGRLFFDYNGNGKQDGEEPAVAGALVQLEDSVGNLIAETLADSSGDYRLEDVRTGSYKLHLGVDYFSDKRLQYMCRSRDDLKAVADGYEVSLQGIARMDVGLMEGFLTMPVSSTTRYEIDRFYDRDTDVDRYLWWNGASGYDTNLKRGYSPNHPGIDYSMEEGTPLASPAPGIVDSIGQDEGGKYIFIRHPNGLKTSCGHISMAVVKVGEPVPRGRIIALSGKSGRSTELANYPHNHFQLICKESIALDPYSPTFEMTPKHSGYYDYLGGIHWVSMPVDSSPNMASHWTKWNDPQYSPQ